jgi:hypothetical protein
MKFLYSIFFAAGVAALAYTKLGKRVGYGNTANVWTIVGVVFVLVFFFFFFSFSLFFPDA